MSRNNISHAVLVIMLMDLLHAHNKPIIREFPGVDKVELSKLTCQPSVHKIFSHLANIPCGRARFLSSIAGLHT
jgi:hypothetical protein